MHSYGNGQNACKSMAQCISYGLLTGHWQGIDYHTNFIVQNKINLKNLTNQVLSILNFFLRFFSMMFFFRKVQKAYLYH